MKSNRLAYKGPPISMNLNKPTHIGLVYTIKQFIDSEKDKQKKCRNYPNKEFSSYEMCDEHFIKEKLKNEFDNVVPFWISNDYRNVTLSKKLGFKNCKKKHLTLKNYFKQICQSRFIFSLYGLYYGWFSGIPLFSPLYYYRGISS